MKILFLQHCLGYGGATKSLILLQKALYNYVDIYTGIRKNINNDLKIKKQFEYSKEIVEFTIPIIYAFKDMRSSTKEFNKGRNYLPNDLINYINTKHIDILHINSTVFAGIIANVKKYTNCKIIVHLREELIADSSNNVEMYVNHEICKYSDWLIAISENEIKFLESTSKVTIIPNPHDFTQTDVFLRGNKKKNKITIGMCANFIMMKGHLFFLDVINAINRKYDKADHLEFVIIGYPNHLTFRDFVKKMIGWGYKYAFDSKFKKYAFNNVKIIPFTFEIYDYLSNIDIYVRPDLMGSPWGRDIIEAMALAKPIVATGFSEFYVENNKTGYLVPVNDVEAMADKIIYLISSPGLRTIFGEKGYNKVRSMCDLNTYGAKINNIYKSVLHD